MSLFNSQSFLLRRRTPGEYNAAGIWVPGRLMEPIDFRGTVHPVSGKTLETLPIGKRSGEVLKLITGTEMTPADQERQLAGDQVEWPLRNRLYEVTREDPATGGLLPHFEYIITSIKEGEE